MAQIKVNELSGSALDWCVAECEYNNRRHKYGSPVFNAKTKRVYESIGLQQIGVNFAPSTDWAQGGPIIDRERMALQFGPQCTAVHHKRLGRPYYGPTPLIAAMRCYVSSKLGDVVEVPDELIK